MVEQVVDFRDILLEMAASLPTSSHFGDVFGEPLDLLNVIVQVPEGRMIRTTQDPIGFPME